MSRPLFILAGNGSYLNRGCEAIVRGTVDIIRMRFQNPRFLVCSYFLSDAALSAQRKNEFDKDITHVGMVPPYTGGKSIPSRIKRRLLEHIPFLRRRRTYRHILPELSEAQAVLSVGGDNYSLDYGTPRMFTDLDDLILSKGKKLVIWGASVGPFHSRPDYETYMAAHLSNVTAIYARESYTRAYLAKIGVSSNVYDLADPAFIMKPVEPAQSPAFARLGETIGLNFSQLMGRYVCPGNEDRWLILAKEIVARIKNEFGLPILLLPHVCEEDPNNNDYLFMKAIIQDSPLEDVSILNPDYSSQELKWIISKLRLFAGARTHATIAALSSCVPTISFSYSLKALGINQDVFSNLDYCLKPGELNPDRICAVFSSVLRDENEIREQLVSRMSEIYQTSERAGGFLKELCGSGR